MTDKIAQALKEKDLGNDAYKAKKFDVAHGHYDKAIELDPTNMSFYTNKAAAFLEEGKYDECIELCKKAVDVGRDQRADFKLISKALARIATAHEKKGEYTDAKFYYDKSLSEHRDPAIVAKSSQLEKLIKETERRAYIDPAKAHEEKEKGNELFKAGRYPEAMKHYNEAIKRDPDSAVLYSNRAACYTKLMEFRLAVADCDTAIKKDPKFVKAYIRKGAALVAMKEMNRATRAYEDALALDPNSTEARDGLRQAMMADNENPEETRKRALQDPEVQAILSDPAMRMILEQMSNNPKSIQEHMKNPDIRDKLLKLIDSGIVQVR